MCSFKVNGNVPNKKILVFFLLATFFFLVLEIADSEMSAPALECSSAERHLACSALSTAEPHRITARGECQSTHCGEPHCL